MTFPASLPSFTNPTGTDDLNDLVGGLTHSGQHAAVNDAVEQIAAALTAGSLTATSYTPTFSTAYGGTIPTVGGSGTATGWYVTVGSLFVACFRFVFSTGATPGTGVYAINPPVPALASGLGGHGAGACTNSSLQQVGVTFQMFNGLIDGTLSTPANSILGAGNPAGMGSATGNPSINGTIIGRRA